MKDGLLVLKKSMQNKNAFRITTSFLGGYAGFLGMQHGIFEILQGPLDPGGVMIQAIGAPCQPEAVWHACYPAMTLIQNLLVSGVVAILVGLMLLVWSAAFFQWGNGGLILALLSFSMLLVGGGFVPVWIGLVAAAAASRIALPVSPGGAGWRVVSALWPWPLVLMALWLPGSWLLGHFFSAAMLSAGSLLFLVFDLGLPVLAAVSAVMHTER